MATGRKESKFEGFASGFATPIKVFPEFSLNLIGKEEFSDKKDVW